MVPDESDTAAREGLLLASFYGGMSLGPVNTAVGHALAEGVHSAVHVNQQWCRDNCRKAPFCKSTELCTN